MMDWNKLLCAERKRGSSMPIRYDKGSTEARSEFERDYDRVIFSNPVKRLQDKTQVFPLDPNDAVRTRLTHSLEVSSVARGLAIAVGKWLLEKGHINKDDDRRSIEAIAATCGIIHDLGNPPFGHSGEESIRHWFRTRLVETKKINSLGLSKQQCNDFLYFEGNAQTLRLLTKLQILADKNGLNLTYGTLSASCKYLARSDEIKKVIHDRKKPGYFYSEDEIVKEIRKKTGTGKARHPITFLVESADDIVYSIADIEDAIKKGIMKWNFVVSVIDGVLDVKDETFSKEQKVILQKRLNDCFNKMVRILIPEERTNTDCINWYNNDFRVKVSNHSDDVLASAFRTSYISIMVPLIVETFIEKYNEIMSGSYHKELVSDCEASTLLGLLKRIGVKYVYNTPSNLKLELMGKEVICDLMDIFWEGIEHYDRKKEKHTCDNHFAKKIMDLVSKNYLTVFCDSVNEPENYCRFQLLTDYICGMTDGFAKRLHAELKNG